MNDASGQMPSVVHRKHRTPRAALCTVAISPYPKIAPVAITTRGRGRTRKISRRAASSHQSLLSSSSRVICLSAAGKSFKMCSVIKSNYQVSRLERIIDCETRCLHYRGTPYASRKLSLVNSLLDRYGK